MDVLPDARPTLARLNYHDYCNTRGHGGYCLFFAHRTRSTRRRTRTRRLVRTLVLQSRESDGAFMDHYMNGRDYGAVHALATRAR